MKTTEGEEKRKHVEGYDVIVSLHTTELKLDFVFEVNSSFLEQD